ncbi:class I SAM-dependent DNA methyltransferase [Deinococcus sp.]|uniref:class I SAM-dependent DNA methyltransferase n=1 Tax=Deinococcus sp. TaxID=47478 RepID=UPI003C7AC0C3
MSESLPPEYFDDMYEAHTDPWQFETSEYEAAKYARTLLALPRARYLSGLEVGCSIGVLTARLARRCQALLAIDVSERALQRARARCAALPQVRFERRQLPHGFPPGRFDLIVLSEVLYYLDAADLHQTLEGCIRALEPGGHLLCVHWTPVVHDYPQTGDEVHAAVLATPGWVHLYGERHEQYRLDLFRRV